MEVVFLVLGVFIVISAVLMLFKYFSMKEDKGFPYSRNR